LAAREQAGVSKASEETLRALAEGNRAYEERFGFIFIVCATGKGADEMLGLLRERLPHARDEELVIAAQEQAKITRLRLEKLLSP
jgi:OHCU decarboxylase